MRMTTKAAQRVQESVEDILMYLLGEDNLTRGETAKCVGHGYLTQRVVIGRLSRWEHLMCRGDRHRGSGCSGSSKFPIRRTIRGEAA